MDKTLNIDTLLIVVYNWRPNLVYDIGLPVFNKKIDRGID